MTETKNKSQRQKAEELLAESLEIGNCINRMMDILGHTHSLPDKDKFVESIGQITGHNADIILRIRNFFPDLHKIFDDLR